MTPRRRQKFSPPLTSFSQFEWRRAEVLVWQSVSDLMLSDYAGTENEIPRDFYYFPLVEEPALFRKFASLDGSIDSFEVFAEKYGVLWHREPRYTEEWRRHEEELKVRRGWRTIPSVAAESRWVFEWSLLRFAVRVFDALSNDFSTDTLDNFFRLGQDAKVTFCGAEIPLDVLGIYGDGVMEHAETVAQQNVIVRFGSNRPPGWEWLARRSVASDVLATIVNSRTQVRISLAQDNATSNMQGCGLRLELEPGDLADALWLQLALAINGNRQYKQCPVCHDWWDATEARSDKETCSDKCRKARSRNVKISTENGGPR